MIIYYRKDTDPYFNIASEEYFVKNVQNDMCMIWINEPSVIIGKHQNAYAEINYPYAKKHNIPIIRRISGGGAVYHDLGNVNFSFIKKIAAADKVDFAYFSGIIKQFVQTLGLQVTSNTRNSLFIGNLKFSGHAEHIYHDKILHHGTLLFNTKLESLENYLLSNKEFQSKALPSVKSEVGNLSPLLSQKIDTQQFVNIFINWLEQFFPNSIPYQPNEKDTAAINDLATNKYKTWKWNFGYSPNYLFSIELPAKGKILALTIKVENGVMTEIKHNEILPDHDSAFLFQNLVGIHHKDEAIQNFIDKNHDKFELVGINAVSFYKAFF